MTTTMIDAMHSYVRSIPPGTKKVAGYVTGTPDVQWTAEDWNAFPDAGHVRIDQSYDLVQLAPVVDVEGGTASPALAAQIAKARLDAGETYAGVYASGDTVPLVAEAMNALGVPLTKVDLWLANWNLSDAEAGALLGTVMNGFTIRAVQWASPTSNPDTPVPGSGLTLKQANVDLSVTQDAWHAYTPPVAPPGPYRHLTTAGQTIAELAASRNTEPATLLARCVHDYTAADLAILVNAALPEGLPWYSDKP